MMSFTLIAFSILFTTLVAFAEGHNYITYTNGAPLTTKDAILSVGRHGPLLVDPALLEEMAHFVREPVPLRTVHSKGAGAFGYFEVTKNITDLTSASIFSKIGKTTPVATRFSLGVGERGSPDTSRDIKGFATKLYTDEGILDLIQLSFPVLFTREPMIFGSFIRSMLRHPVTGFANVTTLWDMMTSRPDSIYFTLYYFSKYGFPKSYRHMNGFAINTYKLVNSKGDHVYCRFTTKTDQGEQFLNSSYAQTLQLSDANYFMTDLYNSIESGNHPSWTVYIQTMTEQQYFNSTFNPADVTKVWPESSFPLREVGKLVLNRNPTNMFAEFEQIAMSPGNLVPGIEVCPYDKLLQARLIAYPDAHRYRIGSNYHQLPINSCPFIDVNSYVRDGNMVYDNREDRPNYHPNSFDALNISERAKSLSPSYDIKGTVARYESVDEDNYSQAAQFYNSKFSSSEKEELASTLAAGLSLVPVDIQRKAVANYGQVSKELGDKISGILGL